MEELLSILEPLDWSRQAAWNLGRGASNAMSSDPSQSQGFLQDILPGLAGLGAGAGLAATGVGLPAAILGGALFSALNQGAYGREAATPSQVISDMGIDPESAEGIAGSIGLSVLTDPLTFGATGAGVKGIRSLMGRGGASSPMTGMIDDAVRGVPAGSAADNVAVDMSGNLPRNAGDQWYSGIAHEPNKLADQLTSDPGIVKRVMMEQMGDKPTIEQLARMVGQDNASSADLIRNLDMNYEPLGGLGDLQLSQKLPYAIGESFPELARGERVLEELEYLLNRARRL